MQVRFWYHYPGMAFASNWYANNEQTARKEIREMLGVKRLPNGFAIWKKEE